MSDSPVEGRARFAVRIVGLTFFLLTAGCAGLEREPLQTDAIQNEAASDEPRAKPPTPTVAAEPEAQPLAASVVAEPAPRPATPPAVAEPVVRPAAPSTARPADQSVAKINAPLAKPPEKAAVPPVPPEQAPKKETPTPAGAKQERALDIAALEKRLRETKAIGVFTKLALKNQVDDLLNQFRAFYQGRAKATLAELRQSYDRLLLKVLTLLQDADQALAKEIVASRDAIWGILADPVKFSSL